MSIQENISPIDVPKRKYEMSIFEGHLQSLKMLWNQYEAMPKNTRKEAMADQIRNLEGYVKAFEFTDS